MFFVVSNSATQCLGASSSTCFEFVGKGWNYNKETAQNHSKNSSASRDTVEHPELKPGCSNRNVFFPERKKHVFKNIPNIFRNQHESTWIFFCTWRCRLHNPHWFCIGAHQWSSGEVMDSVSGFNMFHVLVGKPQLRWCSELSCNSRTDWNIWNHQVEICSAKLQVTSSRHTVAITTQKTLRRAGLR